MNEGMPQNQESSLDLIKELQTLGIDSEELNKIEFELYKKYKEGILTKSEVVQHRGFLWNISHSPSQEKLIEYLSGILKK